jgi:DNA polymerase-4
MELRATRRQARRVGLQLDYTDGTTVSRQASVRKGVADDHSLQRLALTALERSLTRRTRVRSCRLIGDRLHGRSPQLNLFADPATGRKKEQLLAAMDRIRQRFGREAIRMGGHPVLH